MEICSVVIFTTFAITVGHERGEVVGVFGVFDVNATIVGVEATVSGHASGADAVKSVDTEFGADE